VTGRASAPPPPAGVRTRDRTPEQIERDRARSRAWHQRQRAIVAQVQSRLEDSATGDASGRRPDDNRSQSPLSVVERTELVALRSEVVDLRSRLAVLEERIENDRRRSKDNNRDRRTRASAHQLPLSGTVPARNRHRAGRAGTPPQPNSVKPPR